MCLGSADRMGSRVRNLFPGLFLMLPAPWHLCPPRLQLPGSTAPAQTPIASGGGSRRGWAGLGSAQGHREAWGSRAAVGTSPRSWLCPEEMALGERRCHAHAERRLDKGCAWEVCSVNWVGIFCLPHLQPLPPHSCLGGPLGSSQSRGSLAP